MASWNASAADALAIWSGYCDFIHVSSVADGAAAPEVSGDGINSAFFSTTVFGESFGEGTLAVTLILLPQNYPFSDHIREADVVVNSAYRFDSYRGPLQRDAAGPVYDFHRIVLHEFGHVLGLDHNPATPLGTKIMEPIISNFDHEGADDVAGIRDLYGGSFDTFGGASRRIRVRVYYGQSLHANNVPTTYTVSGNLPPGITLKPAKSILEGFPTKGGVYDFVVTAHNPTLCDISQGYRLTVLDEKEIPGLLSILPLENIYEMVSDPTRPRLYVSSPGGISMVDTDSLAVQTIYPKVVGHLSLSADGFTLLIANSKTTGGPGTEYRLDLATLTALDPISIPAAASPVLEGLNNQAYVAGDTTLYQFDATTGALQQPFGPTVSGPEDYCKMVLSPDRVNLYAARNLGNGSFSSYDVSGTTPRTVQEYPGTFPSVAISPDGKSVYYVSDNQNGQLLLKTSAPELNGSSAITSARDLGATSVAPDGTIFQAVFAGVGLFEYPYATFSLFNPTTLKEMGTVDTRPLITDQVTTYMPFEVAFDNVGEKFFARIGANGYEVWAFSRDFASYPPAHAGKNLLNVSTRTFSETGSGEMIGGFIIEGVKPKKVVVRALGPSLPTTGAISDPVLQLYDSSGKLIASNDNWTTDRMDILASQLAPTSEREAAIQATLPPGAYTAAVHDARNQPGTALVEVYDLEPDSSSLTNISTRGKVGTGNDVMIGGFIVGGNNPARVLVRALGPSLAKSGIAQPLSDPYLEIHDENGKLIYANDNWRTAQQAGIAATGIPPSDEREAAIVMSLSPGSYTAIVRGANKTSGVALVEVYDLDSSGAVSK